MKKRRLVLRASWSEARAALAALRSGKLKKKKPIERSTFLAEQFDKGWKGKGKQPQSHTDQDKAKRTKEADWISDNGHSSRA